MSKTIKRINDISSNFKYITTGKPSGGSISLNPNYFSTYPRVGKKIVKKELGKKETSKPGYLVKSTEDLSLNDWEKVGLHLKKLYGEDTSTFSLKDLDNDTKIKYTEKATKQLKANTLQKAKKAISKYKPITLKKEDSGKKPLVLQLKELPKVKAAPKAGGQQKQQQQLEKPKIKATSDTIIIRNLDNDTLSLRDSLRQSALEKKSVLQYKKIETSGQKPKSGEEENNINNKEVSAINKGVNYLNNYSKILAEKRLKELEKKKNFNNGNGTYLENLVFMNQFPLALRILSGKESIQLKPRLYKIDNPGIILKNAADDSQDLSYVSPNLLYSINYDQALGKHRMSRNSAASMVDNLMSDYLELRNYLKKLVHMNKLTDEQAKNKYYNMDFPIRYLVTLLDKLLKKYREMNFYSKNPPPSYYVDEEPLTFNRYNKPY